MANKQVLHKRSGVAGKEPNAAQLDYGELAINFTAEDEKIFIKNSENAVIPFIPKRAFIEAPIVNSPEYLLGTQNNGIFRIDPSSLDTSAYTFDMSLITSSSANVGVRLGIQNTAGTFVNTAWNIQGGKGHSGTTSVIVVLQGTTEHSCNVTVGQKEFGDNVFYVNVYNNSTNLTTANITTNMPLVNIVQCFENCRNLTSIECEGVCPTNMAYTFNNCFNLTTLDGLANWNTGNVTSMAYTFYSCYKLTSLDPLANWNTGKVTNMSNTFFNCHNLTTLEPLANWDVANVTSMGTAFRDCSYLTNIDGLANWNVAKVTNMCNMFYDCRNAQNHGFNNWNGASANCANMFRYCNSLDDIQIHWNITCAANMFANRNTRLNVYASTSTNAYNALYRAMGNSTTNSSWNVTLYELNE